MSASLAGVIWLAIVGIAIRKFRKKRRGGYDEALRNAGHFFGKHRAKLV